MVAKRAKDKQAGGPARGQPRGGRSDGRAAGKGDEGGAEWPSCGVGMVGEGGGGSASIPPPTPSEDKSSWPQVFNSLFHRTMT